MPYTLKERYELIVDHYYMDNGQRWFRLRDDSNWKLNVPAFPFQSEGWEGRKIVCIVTNVAQNGYPWFQQDKYDLLSYFYQVGESYKFNVLESAIDSNGQRYYKLFDPKVKVTHRCYTDETLSGMQMFKVTDIRNRHIHLSYVPQNQNPDIAQDEVHSTHEIIDNPFGQEDLHHEWKASLVYSSKGDNQDGPNVKEQIRSIMEGIAAFQNTEGGLLYIGINEKNASICGIEKDYDFLSADGDKHTYHKNTDGFANKIECAVSKYLGKESLNYIKFEFYVQRSTSKIFCIIVINKTPRPVYVLNQDAYKRSNKGHWLLQGNEITDLVRFKDNDKSAQQEFTRPMPDDCYELNPNQDKTKPEGVFKLPKNIKSNYYFMTFYNDNTFLYSTTSHASENNVLSEVRFNKIDGNLEDTRDLLAKCTKDGHVLFLHAYDICKLGEEDTHIPFPLDNIATIKVVNKYDFLKVRFTNGQEKHEKDIRVVSLFGKNTETNLKSTVELLKLRQQIKNTGNAMIPKGYTLTEVQVIKEVLPDEVICLCAKSSDKGINVNPSEA